MEFGPRSTRGDVSQIKVYRACVPNELESAIMIESIIRQLHESSSSAILELLSKWHVEEHESLWRRDPRLYREFGNSLVKADHPIRAYELLREGLIHHPHDLELGYRLALSLARGRNISKAEDTVGQLMERIRTTLKFQSDVLSLLARLKKDRFELAVNPEQKAALAAESAALYEQAWTETGDVFPAVNAASMYLLAGHREMSTQLARLVIERSSAGSGLFPKEGSYWDEATLGEAFLLLDDLEKAHSCFKRATDLAQHAPASLASMRRQLLLLAPALPRCEPLLKLFPLGSVVVFAGHMIDSPRRVIPRFPSCPELECKVAMAIRDQLKELDVRVGYASLACGSDILFGEAVLERGAELHVVLPYHLDDFYHTSVDFLPQDGASWRARCDALLKRATTVHFVTKEHFLGDKILLEFATTVAQGLAILHSANNWTEHHALVVIDPDSLSEAKCGGTSRFLELWGIRPVKRIDLAALRAQCGSTPHDNLDDPVPEEATSLVARREIKYMLFADVKNFSGLEEEKAPLFFEHYFRLVSQLLESIEPGEQPVFQNTWGDGLFLVFEDVIPCARWALSLLDATARLNWVDLGLPSDTSFRIGLHAGPVYRFQDPAIGKPNFFGSHVNRAARIETVAAAGSAFASEQFVAVLTVTPDHEFVCEYIGMEALAKGFDRCPLYRVSLR